MHGLLGSNKNFSSVCSTLAGHDSEQKVEKEGEGKQDDLNSIIRADTQQAPSRRPPNHWSTTVPALTGETTGDSFHHLDTTLGGLSEDLQLFLNSYSSAVHIGATELEFSSKIIRDPSVYIREASGLPDPVPLSPDATPVPIVLVAHSMGAMVLMHWVWREHIKIWSNRVRHSDHSPTLYQNVFTNDLYKIVGAVVVDMAPSDRPVTFNNTIRMIEFLTQIPLLKFKNVKEVEAWLLENGPKDVFNQQNIFQIRYHLSNLDFSDKNQPRWKIGLSEIIGGLHAILWEEGGFESMKLAWETLNFANRRRVLAHKPIWEHAEKFSQIPFCFIFGETSSYYNPKAVEMAQKHFQDPHIVDIKGADHFLFMRHKPQFMRVLRGFLQEIEEKTQR